MSRTLHVVELGLRRGLREARDLVRTPEAAMQLAQQLLRDDPEGAAEFAGHADLLAGYLRHVAAHGRVDESAFEAELSDSDREALWLADWERSATLRDEFHGDLSLYLAFCRSEHRQGRAVAPVARSEVPAAPAALTASAASPAPSAPTATAKLAATPATSARLSISEVGERLGMPRLDELPMTARLAETLRGAGLRVARENGEWHVDAGDVARLAANREACDRLLVQVINSTPLRFVGGDGAVAIGGRR